MSVPWEHEPDCDAPVCDECGRPGELVDALCLECRCACCGDPAAPVEWRGERWCSTCAVDAGYVAPLAREEAA